MAKHLARHLGTGLAGGATLAAAAAMAAVLLTPNAAQACGGLFCDGGPQPMPVDQTGEDILFVTTPGHVEAHIRILYEGEAEAFAWVIPLQSVPTDFSVGSEQFFENIKAASVPTYDITTQRDACASPQNGGLSGGGDTDSADSGFGTTGDTGDPGGPTIFVREQVGAFEITVLGGGTAQEVVTWLDDNGYQQDPEALPIIEEYLADNHLFAAIKLTGSAGIEEIHPIVLDFDHEEACVPLKLTRIAAVDDMEVRTYFLGGERVVPMNYRHVLVNPLMLDWPSRASNYKEVITAAVDVEHADGRAFVTEYAGPSSTIATFDLASPDWNAEAYRLLDGPSAIETLKTQGLVVCTEWDGCTATHPLVDGVVQQYVALGGVTLDALYDCPTCYEGLFDTATWDGSAFADTLEERIFAPGRHAQDLVATHPYLSRMYTIISPHEMTEDPMFHANASLEEVSNLRTATQRILCSNDSVWTLPDGRQVFVPAGMPWPEIDGLPWEEEVQEIPSSGPAMALVDNTEKIDAALEQYNAPYKKDGEFVGAHSVGCDCRAGDDGRAAAWSLFGLLGLLGLRRRR